MEIRRLLALALVLALAASTAAAATTTAFVVAAYNLDNWILMTRHRRPDQPKPAEEKDAVVNVLATIHPDVLGLAEMGTTNDLADLTRRLTAHDLNYPYTEWIQGIDTNRHVALLSRFPITARHSRATDTFTIGTNVLRLSRGILDVDIKVNDHYSFRAVVAHLKSHYQDTEFDQAVTRIEEARVLRRHVEHALQRNPALNMIVMGDFNDTPETEPVQTIIGKPPLQLLDVMPEDRAGGHNTHFWRYRKLWSRIDYLLLSPSMTNRYLAGSARIADVPGWDQASDHRAVSASFRVEEESPAHPAVGGTTSLISPPNTGTNHRLIIFALLGLFVVADGFIVVWLLPQRTKL